MARIGGSLRRSGVPAATPSSCTCSVISRAPAARSAGTAFSTSPWRSAEPASSGSWKSRYWSFSIATSAATLVLELRAPPLLPRALGLLEVLRGEAHEELRVALELDRRVEAPRLEARPHDALGERDALRAPAVDRLGEVERGGHELDVGDRARDEPDRGRLARRHVAPREHDLERARGADRAREQEGETELRRRQAVVDAGGAEVGRLGGDPDVGAEGEAEPAADRRPVHGADHRLRHAPHRGDEAGDHRHRPRGETGSATGVEGTER